MTVPFSQNTDYGPYTTAVKWMEKVDNLQKKNIELLKACKLGLKLAESWVENEGVYLEDDINSIKEAIAKAESK